jgi:hypothetical protein
MVSEILLSSTALLKADRGYLSQRPYPIDVTAAPPKIHPHAVIGPTHAHKRLGERGVPRLPVKIIIFIVRHEHTDASHVFDLLGPRHQRPRRRVPEPRDEIPPSHP